MIELKVHRTRLGIDQREMAKRIGVSVSYYQKVEQGVVLPGNGFIRKFKKAFPSVGIDMFFAESR